MPSARPAAVGGFVLGGLAIVVAAILFFGGEDVFSRKTKAVVYFEGSVGGLVPGAPVTFRGVRVGSVSKVMLAIDPNLMRARIPVYLKLEPDRVTLVSGATGAPMLRRLIAAGLRAKLESESLVTGQMLVDLDFIPGARGATEADAGTDPEIPEIPAITSDLQQLREELTRAPIAETVTQALHTLAAVETIAEHIDARLLPLAGSAQRTLDSAARTVEIAGDSIQQLQRDVSSTLGAVQALASDGRVQLGARGKELSQTLLTAEKTLQAVNTLVVSTNSLVAPGAAPRDDLEATLRDLAATAGALRELSRAIERDPTIVVRGRAGAR
jgi:paraquat-inducible protein B